jgi:hypothetical protein
MRQDREHLRILSICHYVYAGLHGLLSLLPGFYIFIGVMMLNMPTTTGPGGVSASSAPPPFIGWFMIALGGFLMTLGLTLSILTAVAGFNLARYRRRTFCFVVACINCINVPLGTVLGVFTIIVLVRPSVKDLFVGRGYSKEEPEYDPEEGEDDLRERDDLPVDPDYARRIRRPLNP